MVCIVTHLEYAYNVKSIHPYIAIDQNIGIGKGIKILAEFVLLLYLQSLYI